MNEEDLIKRIEALEKWKADRERQQVTFPLDSVSVDILNKHFVSIIDEYQYSWEGGAGGNTFEIKRYEAQQGKDLTILYPAEIRYTADPSSDVLSVVEGYKINVNKFFDTMRVNLFTTDTAPGGLSAGDLTTYYVVQAAADGYSFKLSATEGGSAINVTNAGVGRQIVQPF